MSTKDGNYPRSDVLIEQFLREEDLEPEPQGFTARVTSQVREERASKAVQMPRFRLTLVDYALSLCAAAVLFVAWLLATSLPPFIELRIRLEAFYWLQRLRFEPQLILAPLGIVLAVVGVVIITWFVVRKSLQPRP